MSPYEQLCTSCSLFLDYYIWTLSQSFFQAQEVTMRDLKAVKRKASLAVTRSETVLAQQILDDAALIRIE